jgi:site-specific DNA-cytosine methylase
LDELRGTSRGVTIGTINGNRPLRELVDESAFIGGPPCEGFAHNGCQLGELDPRSQSYLVIATWIVEWAKRGVLKWYAIENSSEIGPGGRHALFGLKMIDYFREHIPGFHHSVENSRLVSFLPHVRNRAWVRGIRKDLTTGIAVPPIIQRLGDGPVPLHEVLDETMDNVDGASLTTPKKRANFKAYLKKINEDKANKTILPSAKYAVFDVDRAFSRVWCTQMFIDVVPSLRKKGPEYMVVSLGDGDADPVGARVCRILSIEERFTLQGHSPKLLVQAGFKKTMALLATGNAYALPMVAAAVLPLMEACHATSNAHAHARALPSAADDNKRRRVAYDID